MQQLQYRHAPEYEQMTPLPPGTYGPPVWKRLLMMLTAFLAFLAGGIMLLFSLANDPRTAGDWVRIVAGFVCVVFVLPAGFVWLFQAMKITLETARARIPMPRSARVQFADVHAIVVFPAVLTAGRDMKLLALLNAEGVSIFQMSAPPYKAATVDGVAALVHRTSRAKVYVCEERVSDFKLFKNINLPHLV